MKKRDEKEEELKAERRSGTDDSTNLSEGVTDPHLITLQFYTVF